jgi:hypothetical protein
MTHECRKTERLLYLFRDGELTPNDRTLLERHLTSCPECRAIRDELLTNDAVLSPGRESLPRPSLVAPMQIPLSAGSPARHNDEASELIVGWLGRGLGIALAACALLFCSQQLRDGSAVIDLERRLHTNGDAAIRTLHAGIAPSSGDFPGIGTLDLLRRNPTLAELLIQKYPGLASVVTADGFDERERRILETEGRAFMNDLEKILQEGGK